MFDYLYCHRSWSAARTYLYIIEKFDKLQRRNNNKKHNQAIYYCTLNIILTKAKKRNTSTELNCEGFDKRDCLVLVYLSAALASN